MQNEVSVEIDRPIDEVFRLTNDHLAEWNIIVQTEFTFEDLSGRTRVTQTAAVTGKGFFKWFMFLFGWMMNRSHCKASENELDGLKRFCEDHPCPAAT